MSQTPRKVLMMRFSALGDVLQSLSLIGAVHREWPNSEIHFVTREDFAQLFVLHPHLDKVWTIPKKATLKDSIKLGRLLLRENFTHIYDPHNNLRSRILCIFLNGLFGWRSLFKHKFLRRPLYRFRRLLLFKFRKNTFPKPFNGQAALLRPLAHWGVNTTPPTVPQLFLPPTQNTTLLNLPSEFVAIAPSAAHELKRWPIEYFSQLIEKNPDLKFVALGGPEDQFISQLENVAPRNVINLAGKLNYIESAQAVQMSLALISNDTGVMHMAEQLGVKCIALMGPAPFGFPSRPMTLIKERNLYCRPCSKHGQGPCVNPEFQKCLRDISAAEVSSDLRLLLKQKDLN